MSFSTENVNVGDKVILNERSSRRVGIVVKKTPSGYIDVDFGYGEPTRYKKNGDCHKSLDLCSYEYLSHWTQEEEDEIHNLARKNRLIAKLRDCRWSNFSLGTLELILEICEKGIEK